MQRGLPCMQEPALPGLHALAGAPSESRSDFDVINQIG